MTDPEIPDDPSTAVVAGFIHKDELKYSFFHSFLQLLAFDSDNTGRVWRGGFNFRRGTTGDLSAGRNAVVNDFLADGKADWLWWIDTDMGFLPDTVERLLEAADPTDRPIVGALCFAQREFEADGVGGYRPVAWPVVMDWNVFEGRGGFEVRWDYPRNTVTRVHGTGSACILIHRSVFERIRDTYERIQREQGSRVDGDPRWDSWYSRVTNPTTGALVGEDLSFCMRLMWAEIPVYVHTGVPTTHVKNIWLQEEDYWRQRALNPPPETTEPIPRERWTVPRYAIVPTHNRPARLSALVATLGPQCDAIIIVDNASDPPVDEVKLRAPHYYVEVIRDEEQPPNLARFWNLMLDRCAELAKDRGQDEWDVALFNDDSVIPDGWYDTVSTAIRGHDTAAVAHTGTTPVHRLELFTEVPYERAKRMCPWAFVTRGELGLRADESMRWWYFDDDWDRTARLSGGVLAVPGPMVINAHANQTTTGVLAEQAEKDRATFEAKWSK